jgi:hypothetical protein
MSAPEIIAELPKLKPEERQEVFQRLCQLQEEDILHGSGPTAEERAALDQALGEFDRDRNPGRPWREVLADLRRSAAR